MLMMVKQEELVRMRKEKALTQHKLSRLAGLGNNAIFRMETGLHRVTKLRAKAVADILGCDVTDLFYPFENRKAI